MRTDEIIPVLLRANNEQAERIGRLQRSLADANETIQRLTDEYLRLAARVGVSSSATNHISIGK